jgi:branched-chain amino acid transport system substrate-binding protein
LIATQSGTDFFEAFHYAVGEQYMGFRGGFRLRLALAILLFAGCFSVPALAERRVALVVGNGAYKNAARLPNPKNDAEDVAAALKRGGFETIVGLDLDKAGMDDATARFARAAREADVAIFYYSGHAMQFSGVNYLMPVDARLTDETDLRRMVRVDDIVADVQQAKNLRIMVLDSCRDNPLAEELKRSIGRTRAAAVSRGLAKIDSPQGMIVAYSTQSGRTAEDGTGRNSPYTTAFLKHIEATDEIGTVFRRVSADVYEGTKRTQLPELSLSFIGEFYLRGRPTPTIAAPSPVPTPVNEAASAWSVIQNTTSQAVLEDFIRQFGGTIYGSLARARLDELKKSLVAVAAPVAPAVPPQLAQPAKSAPPVQQAVVAPPTRPSAPSADAPKPAVGVFPASRTVKIGVLSDMSSLYADLGGPGSTAAAKLAIADFAQTNPEIKVELLSSDHQNKPDIGSNIASQWFDVDKVDMIVDTPNSGVALAVSQVTTTKNKVFIVSGAASSDLTGPRCNANTVHWTYDTWMLANSTAKAVVKTGGNSWFFLTADYAFGHALERDTAAVVEKNGGKVLNKVRHPLNTSDFSSFLLQAQASKAKVIGLANAGGDTLNSIKQAAEFGIVKGGQSLAGLLIFASDVNALGLATAQGLVLTESWYWDANDANRAWTKRWQTERPGKFPNMVQAGVYAGTLHYLKSVAALKSATDGKAVVAKMKETPTDDPLFGKGTVRADGRKTHDVFLFEVKKPSESKYPGDLYKLRATIPASEAFRPLAEGNCPLARG